MPTLLFQGHCILDGVVVVVAIGVVVVVVVGCFGAGPRRFRARLVSSGKPRTPERREDGGSLGRRLNGVITARG